ncbi:MAG: OmpA family protein [Gammaproteobacteria bacterium]|nr:OmpA family protein [Gammaproteobacteria bacterium]
MKRPLSPLLICTSLLVSLPLSNAVAEPSGQYFAPMLTYIQADKDRNSDNGFGAQIALGQQLSERWNLELNFNFDTLDFESGSGEYKQTGLQLDGLYFFNRGSGLSTYGILGVGMLRTTLTGDAAINPSANIGLGLMKPIGDAMQLRAELRYRLDEENRILGADRFEDLLLNVGLMIPFGEKAKPAPKPQPAPKPMPAASTDSDNDGIADSSDRCPNTAQNYAVDANGCALDSDNDGVADAVDRCSDTPAERIVDQRGCEKDADSDGVTDALDQCPDTAPERTVDLNGCEKDSDRDGVVDALDACPNTEAGVSVNAKGCIADRDGDGVLDNIDQCLDSAMGAKVDESGCKLAKVIVLKGVTFKTGSAELTSASGIELDQVVSTMNRYPTLEIKVSGYTDNRGAESFNQQLSQKRAQAVVTFLTDRGISAQRLQAKGYGPANPIADNNTADGRMKNRRVELHILKR